VPLVSTLLPIFRRTATTVVLAVAALVAALGLVAASAVARPALTGDSGDAPRIGGRLPDLAVVVSPAPAPDETERLVAVLGRLGAVAAVGAEPTAPGSPAVVLVTAADGVDPAALVPALRDRARSVVPTASVSVGGQPVVDAELTGLLGRGVLLAVVPATVLVLLAAAAALGVRRGLAVGAGVAVAVAGAWALGGVREITFDGTVVAGPVPVVLGALAAAVTAGLWWTRGDGTRAPAWFRAELVVPLLVVAGPAAALDLWSGGRSVLAPVVAGVAIGLLAGTVVPAVVAGEPSRGRTGRPGLVDLLPDGRRFPTVVLLGFAAALVILAVPAPGPFGADLLDARTLPARTAPVEVARALAADPGGDPTAGLVVRFAPGTGDASAIEWAEAVSTLPGVAWVETAGARFASGGAVEGAAAADVGSALVTVVGGGRSPAAQQVSTLLARVATPEGPVEVSGPASDARAAVVWHTRLLPVVLLTLAAASGLVVLLLGRDLLLALASALLRLVGLAAGVGAYRLAGGPLDAPELEVVVALVGTLALLFDGGVVAAGRRAVRAGDAPADALDGVLGRAGLAAVAGLVAVAGVGLAAVGGELIALRRTGTALVVSVALLALVELWLLRPAMLAGRWERRWGPVSRPARRTPPAPLAELEWRRIVSSLFCAEFLCQRDPHRDGLAEVVVPGSALWEELDAHQRQLRADGLRVQGSPPRIAQLEVLRPGSPTTLLVTVAHAERTLVDDAGRPATTRPAEVRRGLLWVVRDPAGRHRIGEVVDLGRVAEAPRPTPAPVQATPVQATPVRPTVGAARRPAVVAG
jgi:hypothetical protein